MRVCHIARFGPIPPGVIKERLTAFDPHSMELTYEAQEGMPRFIVAAVNRWSVHAIDEQSCRVRTQATLELRGVATLLGPLLKWRLRANGARVLEELRHQIEHGRPHPRKFAAMGRVHPAV